MTMPSPRTTYVLALLVLLCTGYVFFFERRFETIDERRRLQDRVLRVTSDEIQRLKIRRDHWTSAIIERVDPQQFRISEPVEAAADAGEMMRLLSAVEFLRSQAQLDTDGTSEQSLHEYGLRPARLEISLELKGQQEVNLLLGKEAPGGGIYAHVLGNETVHVVDKSVLDLFDRQLDRITGATELGEERAG